MAGEGVRRAGSGEGGARDGARGPHLPEEEVLGPVPDSYFVLARCLPQQLFHRRTGWMPESLRSARNLAVFATAVEVAFCLVSLPLGVVRPGIGRISAGINAVLAVLAAVGLLGSLKCLTVLALVHAVLVWLFLILFFGIYTAAILTSSDPNAPIGTEIFIVFAFMIFDLVAAILTGRFACVLMSYERKCRQEDEVAGGPGMGVQAAEIRWRETMAHRAFERGLPAYRPAPRLVRPPVDADVDREAPGWNEEDLGLNVPRPLDFVVTNELPPPPPGPVPPPPRVDDASVGPIPDRSGPLDPDRLCPICMDRPRNAAFVDCGHTVCSVCAKRVNANFGHCFACRQRIKAILPLYG